MTNGSKYFNQEKALYYWYGHLIPKTFGYIICLPLVFLSLQQAGGRLQPY